MHVYSILVYVFFKKFHEITIKNYGLDRLREILIFDLSIIVAKRFSLIMRYLIDWFPFEITKLSSIKMICFYILVSTVYFNLLTLLVPLILIHSAGAFHRVDVGAVKAVLKLMLMKTVPFYFVYSVVIGVFRFGLNRAVDEWFDLHL